MVRHSAALLSLAVLCNGSDALARNPRDVFPVEAEWRKSPDAEITCVGRNLRPGGSSKPALIEQGIPRSDGGVAPERASCRIQMAQLILLAELTSAQTGPYGVDALTLGSKVAFGTPAYRQYRCVPSQKFEGFVWCTKTISDREGRGRFKEWFSILHAQDGAVVYVNRYQEPAYWSANEVAEDIQRYARKIGEEPHIIQLPVRPGLPKGTLATWGKESRNGRRWRFKAPYALEDNGASLLDHTDLVFINPVGTGYSAAIAPAENGEFLGS